jgi:hypothetical protein
VLGLALLVLKDSASPPYGLSEREPVMSYLNMPEQYPGSLPPTLSQTGAFTDTPSLTANPGLIPYGVIVPFWSDTAVKTRWLAVPTTDGTAADQIGFAPTGEWTFPNGTVFVKHFELITDYRDLQSPRRRLETRLLVRSSNGGVYGVTYKWRPDNSDADLLKVSQTEKIVVTNADATTWTQSWYYPSPGDCLTCHARNANYVLGVKTRQLDADFVYPSGQSDNQLRALNHLGLFNPAIEESAIPGFSHLEALTNASASWEDRARSYIDSNCAQCHRPGGIGPSFDARWDTALTNQHLINGVVSKGTLGIDKAAIVVPQDICARFFISEPTV